jgi:RimJ/RimL family protein N-acetyltransferase
MRSWLSNKLGEKLPENTTCIGQEKDGNLIAVIGYCGFRAKSCLMHVAAIDENWISKDLLWATFDYPFNKLGVSVILATVSSNNKEALKLDRHLGFVDKAYIEDAHEDGDLVILAMRRENCRWLDINTTLNGA